MADRGRRALPVDNRLCNNRWIDRCQRIHREKLLNMKSTASEPRLTTLDNTMPSTLQMPHLHLKPKKAQLEEERYTQIELENRVLLEKMSKIMRQDPTEARSAQGGRSSEQFPFRSTLQLKPGVRIDTSQYPVLDSRNYYAPKSLNRDSRLRELRRITSENQAMLMRIQSREPHYNRNHWTEQSKKDQQYLRNIQSREIMMMSQKFQSLPPLPHSPSMRVKSAPPPMDATDVSMGAAAEPAVEPQEPPPAEAPADE